MLRVARSTIPTVPMPSLASPYLVRQSLSVALSAPVSLEVRKRLRVVLRPSPVFQLQSILLCLLATTSGVLLLLHPSAFHLYSYTEAARSHEATVTPLPALPVAGSTISAPSLSYGEVLGRIQIARLHTDSLVREGADRNILQTAVGHVPNTGVPEQLGNFALAGHRETLFSSLRAIRPGDSINFLRARESYRYRVFSTRIVKDTDISVLKPDGGFAPKAAGTTHEHSSRILTLITCYPFARSKKVTERFIVQADLQSIEAAASSSPQLIQVSSGVRSGKRPNRLAVRVGKEKRTFLASRRLEPIAKSQEVSVLLRRR